MEEENLAVFLEKVISSDIIIEKRWRKDNKKLICGISVEAIKD